MSKVILEFDGHEEQDEIHSALNGYKYKMAFWDLDQKLRETTKYGKGLLGQEATDHDFDYAELFREMIREVLNDYNLPLD